MKIGQETINNSTYLGQVILLKRVATNYMAYGTRKLNAAFTKALK